MKQFFTLFSLFLSVILVAYTTNEYVKLLTAKSMGYESEYDSYYVRLMFHSPNLNDSLIEIKNSFFNRCDTTQNFRKDPNWIKLIKQDRKNFAIIEFSGKLFTTLVSILGLIIWRYRRKKGFRIRFYDWISLMFSLVFWRELILAIIDLFNGYKLCRESELYNYFKLDYDITDTSIINIGIIFTAYIVLLAVPKNYRIKFIIAGLLAGISGFYLLGYHIGKHLF
jgi:hypothetical protein